MKFAVIKDATVVNVVEVADGSNWHPGDGLTLVPADCASAGWTYDGKMFLEPEHVQESVQIKTIFDGTEFLSRLTDAEYGAILSAASRSIQLARWLDIFRLRGEIDVTGNTALAAKTALTAMGLLTSARADVIFAPG